MKQLKTFVLIVFMMVAGMQVRAGNEGVYQGNDSINHKRLTGVVVSEGVIAAGSLTGLYQLWYADYPQSEFHTVNDNNEWLLMDKCGHTMTSYYIGKVGYEALRWSGVKESKSVWYGGLLGLGYLGVVEVFDGFSRDWGFSPGDMAANSLGSALFISQQLAWKEQKIVLKWSFHLTKYAQYNRAQMGTSVAERMLKDYNGQTYWLSGNIASLMKLEGNFPKWINLAIGYGAEGMTGPRKNPLEVNGQAIPGFTRYPQFYLAPDIDLTRIRTRSSTLRLLLNAVGFIKFPMPALEFSEQKLKFHFLFF